MIYNIKVFLIFSIHINVCIFIAINNDCVTKDFLKNSCDSEPLRFTQYNLFCALLCLGLHSDSLTVVDK